MKINRKALLFIILIIILIIVGFFACWVLNKNFIKNNISPSPVSWNEYNNTELGFSMKIPAEVFGLYKCPSPQKFMVPLKTFEDNQNGVAYLAPEYYYQANWDSASQQFVGECKKIQYSLESLKSETFKNDAVFPLLNLKVNKPWLGWAVITRTVSNEDELNNTIKEMLGSGCAHEKENWKQAGVYEIKIGEKNSSGDVNFNNTTCPVWNYSYKALYFPDKNKFVFIKLGQECTFGNISNSKCYDEEIINSLELQ
jgi:hypothetical protein